MLMKKLTKQVNPKDETAIKVSQQVIEANLKNIKFQLNFPCGRWFKISCRKNDKNEKRKKTREKKGKRAKHEKRQAKSKTKKKGNNARHKRG